METEKVETECYLNAPMMEDFFRNKRKNEALMWVPVQCSLLFSHEFQQLCTPSKYIFVAFMLTCGVRGKNELPFNIKYLAQITGVNRRTMRKGIDELLSAKMLTKRERKKEEKEKKAQHRQTESENVVVAGVDSQSFKTENENNSSKKDFADNGHRSRFTLEECLKYARQSDGVRNPNALASNLYQTGNGDAFIMAMLYPIEAEAEAAKIYGSPIGFTNEPCSICFGAKMADTDGKGYRKCVHCQDERGKSTGFEPQNG